MSTIIQIKRSSGGNAPSTTNLAEAELAYSQDASSNGANAILYIESVDSGSNPIIHKIGGKYYTDIVDTATSLTTANKLVKRDANGNFSANVITATTFFANVTGIANSATQFVTPRLINLGGDLEGNVLFDGSQDVTIIANVISNSVRLGTDTVGDYVANVTSNTSDISISVSGAESANVVLSLPTTGVTQGVYGGTTNIPIITVDSRGRIASAANATISTTLNLSGNTGSNSLSLINDTLAIKGGVGVVTAVNNNEVLITNIGVTGLTSAGHGIVSSASSGNVSLTFTGVGNIAGTANEIEVSAGSGNVVIGLPQDVTITRDLNVGRDLAVTGNLYVTGTAVTIGTTSLSIQDPLIHLANNNTSSDVVDIGFEGHYFDATFGNRHTGLFRDADDGKYKFFSNVSVELEAATTVDTDTANGFTIATVVANLEATTANINVANVYGVLQIGSTLNQIVSLDSANLEVRGGYTSASGGLSLKGGDTSDYSRIYLSATKTINLQGDTVNITRATDPSNIIATFNLLSTNSTSTSSGAFVVTGGIGVSGNVYASAFHGNIDGGVY